ncbi:efflux RND transporter periplasmic adaptor subunit [Chryseolinea sp. T2]|uniref:efflux RND transporter periplasmic adaptor subunit n=1 Tax=Chryseolinea sp. T2 TaxID=3129255 RepID=UPI0030789747
MNERNINRRRKADTCTVGTVSLEAFAKYMNDVLRVRFVAACLVAVAITSGCSRKEDTQPVKAAPKLETFNLQKELFTTELGVPGELISYQQVDLYARETSFVKKLYVDVGSEVKQGDLLISMEAPEINSRLSGAESRYKSQEAVYTASKATYDRLLETSKTPGTVSQNDLDQAKARMNADLAQLESAKASFQEVGDTRRYLEIRAPFSGVVSARNVNLGAYVGPTGKGSEFPLLTLQEQRRLRLVVSVPEAYTSFFKQGDSVQFRVKARATEVFHATIKRHAGALDTKLRSERVEMDVDNSNGKLLPGMIAEVSIPLKATDSTFVVPTSSIVNSAEGVFVLKVQGDTVNWVTVRPGRTMSGRAEVFGNLRIGDELIKAASEEVRKGSRVR